MKRAVVIENVKNSTFDFDIEGDFDVAIDARNVEGGSMKAVVKGVLPPAEIIEAYQKLRNNGAPHQVATEQSGLLAWLKDHLFEIADLVRTIAGG